MGLLLQGARDVLRQSSSTSIRAGALHDVARVFSGLFAPPVTGVAGLLAVGGVSTRPAWSGLAWAVALAVGCGAPPLAYLLVAGSRGRSPVRYRLLLQRLGRGRRTTTAVIALSALAVNSALLAACHGPRRLLAFVVFSAGGVAVAGAVTRVRKISVHTGVLVSIVGWLGAAHGNWAVLAIVLAGVMGWARVKVGAHTPAEAIYGLLFGLAWTSLAACLYGPWA